MLLYLKNQRHKQIKHYVHWKLQFHISHYHTTLSYWMVNLSVTNIPKREGRCNQLNYYAAAEAHPLRTKISLQTELSNQHIIPSVPAYVTGTLDLIQRRHTVQDFKRGRGDGPELLMLQQRLLERYCISFIWSGCALVSAPMPLAHQQDPRPHLLLLSWPSHTLTAVKSVPSNSLDGHRMQLEQLIINAVTKYVPGRDFFFFSNFF